MIPTTYGRHRKPPLRGGGAPCQPLRGAAPRHVSWVFDKFCYLGPGETKVCNPKPFSVLAKQWCPTRVHLESMPNGRCPSQRLLGTPVVCGPDPLHLPHRWAEAPPQRRTRLWGRPARVPPHAPSHRRFWGPPRSPRLFQSVPPAACVTTNKRHEAGPPAI